MTKTQENNLCFIMGRIARSLERIARAVDKPDDGEKTDVIRCGDCKNWDTSWKPSADRKCFYCPVVDSFVDGDFWCKFGERKE